MTSYIAWSCVHVSFVTDLHDNTCSTIVLDAFSVSIKVITKLPNSEQSYKGKVQTHNYILCDKACQWLVTCRWFSPGTPVSSPNKTYLHDITEILLKGALNTIRIPLVRNLFLTSIYKCAVSWDGRAYDVEVSWIHVSLMFPISTCILISHFFCTILGNPRHVPLVEQ
jgi:hypothetical protein